MKHKMADDHKIIKENLTLVLDKCKEIETKWEEVGAVAAAQNPQLQGFIDSLPQIIQNQLQPLISQLGLTSPPYEAPKDYLQTRAVEGSSAFPMTEPTKIALNSKAYQSTQNTGNIGFKSDATRGIEKDIEELVERVNRFTTNAAALKVPTLPEQVVPGKQSQGMFLYREVRYTPDSSLPGTPLPARLGVEAATSAPQTISSMSPDP